MVERVCQIPQLFPTPNTPNRVICTPGIGETREFSALITDVIPDLHVIGASQCFPLYYYDEAAGGRSHSVRSVAASQTSLSAAVGDNPVQTPKTEYVRKDGVSDFILKEAQSKYVDKTITKEDIFYYVYGFLHSREYLTTFSADLKKILARIPLVETKEDFLAFSRSGRELAELHLHYEDVDSYPGVEVTGAESEEFLVQKMRFVTKGDKSRIQYNAFITVANIPVRAYEYVVNGKSAIEWIMERYAIPIDKDSGDKDSGIKNDPNEWAAEYGNPRYILDLLLSVITVSMKTREKPQRYPASMVGEFTAI